MRLLAICALLLPLQDPGEVLARYQLDGKPAVVTRTDVAVEMAFHLRRKDLGREACKVLVDSVITQREAERLDLMPADDEVRDFWASLKQQLREAGRDPDSFAAVRNSTEAEWLHDLSIQLAQERLVRHELELEDDEPVSGDMLRLWIAEKRKSVTVVTDPDLLPLGTAARVDGRDIPLSRLGSLLLRTSEDSERTRFIRQVVYLNSIEQLASQQQIEIDQAQLDAAIERRRRLASRNPRYRGLSFEQLLQTQGLTLKSLKQSRVFRAKVLQERLTEQRYPASTLRAELESNREAIDALVGQRRHLGVIYRRALTEPNALVPHDFASAAESLERVRERLEIERFDIVARIESDDPASKELGGDTGWHTRRSGRLPETVLATVFAAEDAAPDKGAVLGPIRADDGCYLVKVLDIEPAPDDAELLQRLRERRSTELGQEILADAAIEWPSDTDRKGSSR